MNSSALLLLCLALAWPAQAKLVTRAVAYEHAGVKLEGWLVYDEGAAAAGKLPGVLVVPEWWGLNDYAKGRAEQLGKLGYVAFAADMYGAGVVTTDAKKAGALAGQFYGKPLMAERARAGLDELLKVEQVDPSRVAAIGYCFGGSTVQALAFSGAPLVGIVSFHGGPISVPTDAAARTKAKLLICHGAIDPFITKEALDTFLRSLDEGKFDYRFISYSGAVHAFTNPGADELGATNGLPIVYNSAADRRSWADMRVFFDEVFAR